MAPVGLHGNLLRVGAVGENAHEFLSSCFKTDSTDLLSNLFFKEHSLHSTVEVWDCESRKGLCSLPWLQRD